MAIWVDADACPNVIKEILFRAAERVQMPLTLVANQNIRVPPSRFIRSLRAPAGLAWQTGCRYGEGHPEKGLNSTLPECAFCSNKCHHSSFLGIF